MHTGKLSSSSMTIRYTDAQGAMSPDEQLYQIILPCCVSDANTRTYGCMGVCAGHEQTQEVP